ncbi:anthranilate phosphoribosyltransferase [Clostridia bacterium]|nr:anthranilate phosphoribosyltransferase [Clostridia bacterium]
MKSNELMKLMNKVNLSSDETYKMIHAMMNDELSPALTASFLTALSLKGESDQEIIGGAKALRKHMHRIDGIADEALDIVGTGGDQLNTINVSTASAFVAAAAGVKVMKHGNRSASSKCGSADVLEELGINISLNPNQALALYRETGMGFMFAQVYHPAMKYVGPIRKELGFRTIFNLLGPLSNPAQVQKQVLGVSSAHLVPVMAEALKTLGVTRGLVVHGVDGLDEISVTGETIVCEIEGNTIHNYRIHPRDFGISSCRMEDLEGNEKKDNKEILQEILSGRITGAKRDFVAMNAGAAIYVSGLADNLSEGIEKALAVLEKGEAYGFLENFREASTRIGEQHDTQ